MSTYNIKQDINKLKELGLLQGKVIDVDLFLTEEEDLSLRQFLSKYPYIKEEDILSLILYEFMEKRKGMHKD